MVQIFGRFRGGGGLGFAFEVSQSLRVHGELIGEKFQGNKSVEAHVFCLVDNAHASTAKLFEDSVVGDGLADEKGRFYH
jgi:hypothetical protein